MSIVRHPPSHEMDGAHPDKGSMSALVSTPLGSSRVRKLFDICDILVCFILISMQDGVLNLLIVNDILTRLSMSALLRQHSLQKPTWVADLQKLLLLC